MKRSDISGSLTDKIVKAVHAPSFLRLVQLLLDNGASINAQDSLGNTPLHYAAAKGNIEKSLSLIWQGANVNSQNFSGETPLHFAAKGNSQAEVANAFQLASVLCSMVWELMGLAYDSKISYGEETITDNICLLLRAARVPDLVVIKNNKSKESKTGADFEFYIGNSIEGWRCHLVQAKRLTVDDEIYEDLGKKKKKSKRQLSRLAECSKERGVTAHYAFYNFLKCELMTELKPCTNGDKSLMGWTIASLDAVEPFISDAKRLPTFSDIHQHNSAFPARCIFCRGYRNGSRGNGPSDETLDKLPDYVTNVLRGEPLMSDQVRASWVIVYDNSRGQSDCSGALERPCSNSP